MREFLFRGKRVDNGEWVEGFFAGEDCELPLSPMQEQSNIIEKGSGWWREVVPETVGQYTGRTDKNGKKIFEGDLVKALKYNETEYIERVYFFNSCYFYGSWNFMEFMNAFRGLEVIGNIHDNPELLKGEDQCNS